jgi:hypothetical protein
VSRRVCRVRGMSVKCDVCTHGKHYLSKGNTIESELADTGGSTATGAPPLKKKQQKCTMCVSVCALTQQNRESSVEKRVWVRKVAMVM